MPRVLCITNPAAARTRPRSVDAIMRTLDAAGWLAELAATTGPGDARRLAAEGVAREWRSSRCSAATARRCRPPRRWSAPT